MGLSTMTLVKIAAIGGIATVSMGLLTRSKIRNNIKTTDYYKDALKSLRSNQGAAYLMGEPIKEGSIEIDDEVNNFTKAGVAQYIVPVGGPKQKGTLYFWAKKNPTEGWIVNRIELGLEKEPDRRLLIKDIDLQKNI